MIRRALLKSLLASVPITASAQHNDARPKPPKSDLPYLLEASKLIPTDTQPATRSKDQQSVTVSGVTSSAKTPVPEPVFLYSQGQISPTQFELFHFQVANGQREWSKGKTERPENDMAEDTIRLTLRPVGEGVIRIEAAEMLDPGEYALIARGQNTAFCFTVF